VRNVLFSIALLAYPPAFRRRFGAEMRDEFVRSRHGFLSLARHVANGLQERGTAITRWAYFPTSTPHLYESSGRHATFWDPLRGDIRQTIRLAIKTPVFTTLTILALALGIGATTAIFALVNGVLLRSLPYRDDAQLVNVWSFNTRENRPRNALSPANFLDFQKMNTTLDGLEGYFSFVSPAQMTTESGAEVAYSLFVTPNMFNMLGRPAQIGRVFNVNEQAPVVVLILAAPIRR
jgi:hypothetical protein